MDKLDGQHQIVQTIESEAFSLAEPGWLDIMINYHVDDWRSSFRNTYVVADKNSLTEKSLAFDDVLEDLMRKLRARLGDTDKGLFTSCKIHFRPNGKYDTTYGYDAVDWKALLTSGWNFPHAQPARIQR